ncbi:MAG TPA: WecB/TagA/CpsF family glycosyltransferase [Leptolyngbyaceae cyanobacterium M33_DOE_097]|uniref:Glycosyltransferase n=1 Tax=Oscillatoriales cyanobacterium SpSt-418 TaxID=2282169 RepID=A0A7C3PDF7_9CYAN|nr:WecB/TagA/CpsF family glycosyltransferase [Leptolyngbyaceae cyanobacterium M33_DOE_097]
MAQEQIQPQALEPFQVLGVPLHLTRNYFDWLLARLKQRQGCHVVTLNAEMTMQAERNPDLATVIHQAELVIPDGAGVVLYLRLHGRRIKRCPGIELAESLLQAIAQQNLGKIVFFGGAPGVAEQAAAKLEAKYPGLAIAHVQNGYLTPETTPVFLQTLKELQPELVLVGLGVPRQEFWIAQHRHLCPNTVWIGVGGSFDVWAGTKQRAPGWLRNNNLEWVYRLYKEPWRWKRMLDLPRFAWRSLLYRLGH